MISSIGKNVPGFRGSGRRNLAQGIAQVPPPVPTTVIMSKYERMNVLQRSPTPSIVGVSFFAEASNAMQADAMATG
jgi:hypothetical protein